jgi:hypothetical protein
MPAGGISPARSLRTTFSHKGASADTFPAAAVSSASPPDRVRPLWQPTQYCLTISLVVALGEFLAVAGDCGPAACGIVHVTDATHIATKNPKARRCASARRRETGPAVFVIRKILGWLGCGARR